MVEPTFFMNKLEYNPEIRDSNVEKSGKIVIIVSKMWFLKKEIRMMS